MMCALLISMAGFVLLWCYAQRFDRDDDDDGIQLSTTRHDVAQP